MVNKPEFYAVSFQIALGKDGKFYDEAWEEGWACWPFAIRELSEGEYHVTHLLTGYGVKIPGEDKSLLRAMDWVRLLLSIQEFSEFKDPNLLVEFVKDHVNLLANDFQEAFP